MSIFCNATLVPIMDIFESLRLLLGGWDKKVFSELYLDIWISRHLVIWISGHLDIWISGHLDIGYLDIFEYLRISLNICGWRFGVGWDQKVWMAPIKIIPSSPAHFFNTFNATTSVIIMIIIIVIIITTIIITIIVVIITRVGLSGLWSISHSDHRQPIFHFLATTTAVTTAQMSQSAHHHHHHFQDHPED